MRKRGHKLKKSPVNATITKKVREKSRECHNYKPQPFPITKRKRKQTKPNKRKSNKRTKSTKISSLFPKRGNRLPTQSMHQSENIKIKPTTMINKDEYSWLILLCVRVNENQKFNHGGPSERHIVKPQPTA